MFLTMGECSPALSISRHSHHAYHPAHSSHDYLHRPEEVHLRQLLQTPHNPLASLDAHIHVRNAVATTSGGFLAQL